MDLLLTNRKAHHDYQITSDLIAGLVLTGAEVKSLRAKRGNIHDAYVRILNGEAYLINARIEPYPNARQENYDPTRSRKLLLHAHELSKLAEALSSERLSAVPLAIGVLHHYLKVRVGLGKGKKQYEKRAALRARDLSRETARATKHQR